jgi:hypothetical protein
MLNVHAEFAPTNEDEARRVLEIASDLRELRKVI